MEETERRNENNEGTLTQNLRVCEYQGLVQIAGQRDKVSPHTCNNPVIVLALASPSNSAIVTRIRRPRRSHFAENHSKFDDTNVVNDTCSCDVARVVSPYFSKNHNALSSNSNVKSIRIVDMNVGSNNCDVAHVVSPYFSKKENATGKDDGDSGEVGGGDRNVGSGGVDDRRNEESCCGMAVVEHEEKCEGNVDDTKVIDERRKNVALRGKRSKKRREDVGTGEVLSLESSIVKERGIKVNYSKMEEEEHHVGETKSSRGVSVVKREENIEDLGIEKDVEVVRKNVLSKGKRSKRRKENVQTGEVMGVESSDVKKGKDGMGYGIGKGELCIRDENLSTGMSEVKQEKKLEDFVKLKEADIISDDVVLKCKKRKRRRENIGTGDILGVPVREVEIRQKIGTSDRIEFVYENTHEDTVTVKDVDLMRKKLVLKDKRSKQSGANVVTGEVVDGQLSEVEKRKGESCYGAEKGEERVGEWNTPIGMPVVRRMEKCKDLGKQKERGRNIRTSDMTCNDDTRVVSPYFLKMDNGYGRTMSNGKKQTKKKKKMKKTLETDRACNELEREASHVMSSIVASPYFLTEGASGYEKSKSVIMEKGVEQKVKKRRKRKEIRTCLGDKEIETKKLKEGKNKKRRVHNECCMEGRNQNKNSGPGSQDLVLSDRRIEVENEAEPEECLRKVTTKSATSGLQEVICQRDHAAEINVEGKCSVSDMENNCESHIKPQGASSPCSKNMRKKRVKCRKLDKNKDDQISPGDEEDHSVRLKSTIRIPKKKHKKTLSFAKSLLDAEQEDVLESSAIESRKEDCIHNNQSFPQASATLNGSPYFQKLPVTEEREDESNEPYCKIRSKRRIDKAALEAFNQLLSKYAYKSDSMNDAGDNVNKDGTNGKVSGKLDRKKKQRGGIGNTNLTRAEKFAEAYRRKDPNNTWRPPSSPYNLLQEDHAHDPWRILVICMLLNITTGPQVKKVLRLFFQRWPNAEAALNTNEIEIAGVIESLGLHRKRAAMIRRFSSEYLSDDWTHVTQLHGIGKYAADAYAIFCNGKWDQVTPNDHMLIYYWKFLQKRREFWKCKTV